MAVGSKDNLDDDFEVKCPRCNSSSFSKPGLTLYVNSCGHRLCSFCLDTLFGRKNAPCYSCGLMLTKEGFQESFFDNDEIEKDLFIRRKLQQDFNLYQEDFNTLEEYDDYLEMVEDIVYNLTHNLKPIETKKIIDDHSKKYRQKILYNRANPSKEMRALDEKIKQEQDLKNQVKAEDEQEEINLLRATAGEKESLLNRIKTSENAEQEVESFKKVVETFQKPQIPMNLGEDDQNDNNASESPNKQSRLTLKDLSEYNYGHLCEKMLKIKVEQILSLKIAFLSNSQSIDSAAGGYELWFTPVSYVYDFLELFDEL